MKPKKLLALLLSLLMALSTTSVPAFAASDTSDTDESYTGSATVEQDEGEAFDANASITTADATLEDAAADTNDADTDDADADDAEASEADAEEDTEEEQEAEEAESAQEDAEETEPEAESAQEDAEETEPEAESAQEDAEEETTAAADDEDKIILSAAGVDENSDSLTVVIPENLSDGTYAGSATVYHDEDEAFSDYPITVAVSVSNGAIVSFSVSGASGNNAQYSTKAENGLNTQLADKTAGSYEVDAVSTATCSSKGIVEAVNAALQSEPSTTSIVLGSAIYDAEGTTFTVTVTDPVDGVDYSDITLAYAVGKFSSDLDETAYSVGLTSQSESELVYTVTITADSGTDIEDDDLTHSVSYNTVGMALNVTVAGTTIGQVTIESSAVYAIENDTLTVTGGNGETLADFIDAASELTISYVDEDTGETVSLTYTLQWQHDVEPEYTGSDIFNEDGSINFDCSVFAYGEDGTYTLTLTATGYNEVTATVGGYVYAYMNVPYADFYAELNDSGAVDAVSSATTSKAANCKNVYLTVDSDAGTTSIYGVVVPVKMSASTYEAVADLVTDSTADYYVGETVEDPAVYLELTYANGAYTFSDIQGTTTTTEISGTTISSASVWGDYEVDLESDNGIATADVYGVYVTTAEGNQYAMKQSENLWTPSNYYEFAWDTIDNDYYADMEGKTIESVTFITTSGIVVYTLDEPLYVQEHMSSAPTAEFTSATTLAISNLAADAADVSVTVKASGRNGASLTDEAKSIVDGVVTLDTAATDGTTYRVTISSSNYASNIVTATYVAQDYYVLMNIPYDEFYAADVNNDVEVDAVSSATMAKTQTWSLSGGSYHVNEDGSDITGVTFPVKVPEGTDLSAYTQITDDDSLTVTVTNRGTTTTTTYTGYQALYQADSYSYYVLSDTPSYYKELTVNEDGTFSFGAVVGESTTITGSAELETDTSYGDYQLSVDGITDYVTAGTDDVYGVVLHTEDGIDYGLRHLENLWRVSELAFCTGFTTSVHNCPTSSAHYEAIMGQTITSITYYTSVGIYEVELSESVYVPAKLDVSVSVEDAYVLDGQATFTVDGELPDGFDAVYSVDIDGAVVDAESGTITFSTDTDLASYTLTISDKNGKYADITASFSLYNYYYMNVPYSVFYSELNDDGDVDAVSSATTTKAANCKNVYMTVDSDAGATTIYGVVIPVKISGSTYSTVKNLVVDSAADYYVGEALESAPTVYLEVSYSSRSGYSFSSIQSTAETATATVDATLSSSSVWGDYELDLDSDYGIATTDVYGVYVTTSDGAQYAMKQSENLWTPSSYYEAAWDTIDNSYYASMEGKTITGVTFITTSGIVEYTLTEALYVTPHMADVPAAEFTSGTTLAITGVAEDAENVTVTVKASGRNGASLTDSAKSIVDGEVTLDTAATDGTTYRVTISSSNYASNIVTATYNVDTTELAAAIEQANALTESNYTADSWAAMQTALTAATELAAATTGKTQAEVDEITTALTDAIAALVDTSALTSAIAEAEALTESDYTSSTWSALETALANARTVAANGSATQAEVDEATDAVTAAIAALEKAATDTEPSGSDTGAAGTDTESDDTGAAGTDTDSADDSSESTSEATSSTSTSEDTSSSSSSTSDASTVKTGDESMITVYVGLLLLSGAAFISLAAIKRKKS